MNETTFPSSFFLLSAFCLASIAPGQAKPVNYYPQTKMKPNSKKYAHISRAAPKEIIRMIRAGNQITNRPYRWAGGHKWNYPPGKPRPDRGYDCSGAVSYLLQKAGLLAYPLDSTGFMRYGKPGKGFWITIYANRKHVFMVVAGLRWDTSYLTDGDRSGPGWSTQMRPTKGFKVRRLWVPARSSRR